MNTERNRISKSWKEHPKRKPIDEKVQKTIAMIDELSQNTPEPITVKGLNGFQRKQLYRHFERNQEYKIKTVSENDDFILLVYQVGKLRRLAEQKAQEVLMKGEPEILPPMGSFERFIIHDYLKEREGITTESFGEDKNRHIQIHPVFGRTPKKAKRRLT